MKTVTSLAEIKVIRKGSFPRKVCFALFAIGVVFMGSVSAQSKLNYEGGGKIQQNGVILKPTQVREIMTVNSGALSLYNSGKSMSTTGAVIMIPGAILFGVGTYQLIAESTFSPLLIGGAVVWGAGFIVNISGNNKIKNSVLLYNSKTTNKDVSYQVNFGLTETGLGVSMRF